MVTFHASVLVLLDNVIHITEVKRRDRFEGFSLERYITNPGAPSRKCHTYGLEIRLIGIRTTSAFVNIIFEISIGLVSEFSQGFIKRILVSRRTPRSMRIDRLHGKECLSNVTVTNVLMGFDGASLPPSHGDSFSFKAHNIL